MKDEQHKNIDDVFRQVINDPANEPEYRQDHWDALEEMLNGKKKPGKMVYWLPLISAAAMMLVTLGWWYLAPRAAQNANFAQQKVGIKKLNGTGTPQQGHATVSLKKDSIISQNRDEDNVATNPSKKEREGTSKITYQNKPELSPVAIAPIVKLTKGNDKIVDFIGSGDRSAAPILLDQPKQSVLPQTNIANHNIDMIDVTERAIIAPVAVSATPQKPGNESWFKRPRLAVTVLASTDINGVNSFSNTSTGRNIGMLVSARFNKLSISTGAYYSSKPYSMPFSAYSPNSAYKFRYAPETVTADCRMLDIPLNIDYQVFAKNKNSISVGTGISSFIMLKESYQYNYANSRVYGLSSYNVSNPDKYMLSSVNFQANYRRQINSKIGLNVMPYVKVPLNNIGYSRVKLQTVGVAVGLNWNINSLAKPR